MPFGNGTAIIGINDRTEDQEVISPHKMSFSAHLVLQHLVIFF